MPLLCPLRKNPHDELAPRQALREADRVEDVDDLERALGAQLRGVGFHALTWSKGAPPARRLVSAGVDARDIRAGSRHGRPAWRKVAASKGNCMPRLETWSRRTQAASCTGCCRAMSRTGRPAGCGHSGSGMRAQATSGRKASQTVAPCVARSMAGQRSGGIPRWRYACAVGALTPAMRATADVPPRASMSCEWFTGLDFSGCKTLPQANASLALAKV